MPRKYSMERRNAAIDETRQRIVDATVELHNEKGVVATSMQDIAARAGVALGTVYRHFPSLDELIPACGGRNLELLPPPSHDVFSDIEDGPARLHALFEPLYEHYEAAQRPYFVGSAEAEHVPVLRQFMQEGAAYIRSLVIEAVRPMSPTELGLGLAFVMADFRTWHAFHDAGFTSRTAAETATQIVVAQLERERSGT